MRHSATNALDEIGRFETIKKLENRMHIPDQEKRFILFQKNSDEN